MGLLITTVVAAATWIVLLSLGIKPFDALLVAILMIFLAATAQPAGPVPARKSPRSAARRPLHPSLTRS